MIAEQPPKKVAFLSKAQREQLRQQKLKEQQEKTQKLVEECTHSKKHYQQQAKTETSSTNHTSSRDRSEPNGRQRERERSRQKQKHTNKGAEKSKNGVGKEAKRISKDEIERLQSEEAKLNKLQYLGLNQEKKKSVFDRERNRNVFNFEWAEKDDTTTLASTNFASQLNPTLLFGKGLQAGIDTSQQKLTNKEIHLSRFDRVMKHWSEKATKDMTDRDWRIFREDNDIITKGGKIPYPFRSWDEVRLDYRIKDTLKRHGFRKPKPIQMQAIPIGMEKKDMIALAPTGQGKTLAYLLPLIEHLLKVGPQTAQESEDGPYSLILAPSRQLAEQINQEFTKLVKGLGLRAITVIGGVKIEFQGVELHQGRDVLIGTPGRIREMIEKKYLTLNQCGWIVMDQADKMIDMDMEPDVSFILDSIATKMKSDDPEEAMLQEKRPEYRVTHLFSATMPPAIERLAKKYLRAFCFISIGEPNSGKKDITQYVQLLDEGLKNNTLGRYLRNLQAPIIIFVNKKTTCQSLSQLLDKWGWTSIEYHGSKSQEGREAAVEQFKSGKYQVLISTDLGSRGLHVDGVRAVINYDAPKNINDYIHRIGRTGRAGKKGEAYTLLTSADEGLFYDLKDFLVKNTQEVPEELENHPASKIKPGSVAESVPRRKQILYAQ